MTGFRRRSRHFAHVWPRDGGDVDVDSKKEWADFIVQIPGDLAPFLFRQGQQLLVQAAPLFIHPREFGGHPIEATLKPRQFRCRDAADPHLVIPVADLFERVGKMTQRPQGTADEDIDEQDVEAEEQA